MTSKGPSCPNHRVKLVDCKDGIGICPLSGARFEYDEDQYQKTKKLKVNAIGQLEETGDWNLRHIDGGDNNP